MRILILTIVIISASVHAARNYTSKVEAVQVEGLNDPYNSIHLVFDVTDSPCSSTNANDRFAISDSSHQAAALAAVVANKEIGLMPTGTCNAADIERINYILIRPNR